MDDEVLYGSNNSAQSYLARPAELRDECFELIQASNSLRLQDIKENMSKFKFQMDSVKKPNLRYDFNEIDLFSWRAHLQQLYLIDDVI